MLTDYIRDVRAVEAAMNPPVEKVGPQESNVKIRARRGLYAARELQPGQVITEDDVLIVRPEGPLVPGQLRVVVGQTATCHIPQYEALSLEQLNRAS